MRSFLISEEQGTTLIGHDPWKSWRYCPGGCNQPIDSGCRERPCQARSSVVSGGVCSQSASRPAVVSAEQSLLPRLCRLCVFPRLLLCTCLTFSSFIPLTSQQDLLGGVAAVKWACVFPRKQPSLASFLFPSSPGYVKYLRGLQLTKCHLV